MHIHSRVPVKLITFLGVYVTKYQVLLQKIINSSQLLRLARIKVFEKSGGNCNTSR